MSRLKRDNYSVGLVRTLAYLFDAQTTLNVIWEYNMLFMSIHFLIPCNENLLLLDKIQLSN